MADNKRPVGRPKGIKKNVPDADRKTHHSVSLSQNERDALELQYGSLTKAILTLLK